MGAFTYPIFANWAWGGGWLIAARRQLRPRPWLFGFRRLWRGACGRWADGPGDGHAGRPANRQIQPGWESQCDSRPRHHDGAARLLHPGLRVVRLQPGHRRSAPPATATCASASIAVNTMLAGMAGSFGAMCYMWIRYGKPDASMTGNGLLAGLVAITAPSGFVSPMASVHHRLDRWRAGVSVRGILRSGAEESTIPSVRSPSTASTASGASFPSDFSPTAQVTTPAPGMACPARSLVCSTEMPDSWLLS